MELVVPDSFRKATWMETLEVCNGCGPESWKYKIDRILFINLFDACCIHDWMYEEGGGRAEKRVADIYFIVNIIIILLRSPSWWNAIRVPSAMLFYTAVHFGGGSSFKWKDTA